MKLAIIAKKINFKAKNTVGLHFIIIKGSINHNTKVLVGRIYNQPNIEKQTRGALKCKMISPVLKCALRVSLHHPTPSFLSEEWETQMFAAALFVVSIKLEQSSGSDCHGDFVSIHLSKFISLNNEYILPCNSK